MNSIRLSLLFLFATIEIALCQQVQIPGIEFYASKLEDTTSLTYYSTIQYPEKDGFWILDPTLKNSVNTGYPRGYNDGPVWKGKGLTTEFHAGVIGKKGNFSFTFHPVVFYSQNAAFDLAPNIDPSNNIYNYQFATAVEGRNLDWVQRYGDKSAFFASLGQTEGNFTFGKFRSSIGTSNLNVGPALFNPIILSNQGPGIPHISIGMTKTDISLFKKPLVAVEANLIYGILTDSDYFNNNSTYDRYVNILSIGIIPIAVFPNLKIAFNKAMFNSFEYFDATDLLSPFQTSIKDELSTQTNDSYDQLAAFSLDWVFPEVGFRAYGTFAKNDFTGGFYSFLKEPEHSRAYTLGFEKIQDISNDYRLRAIYEHTNLSRNHTYLWRATPTFYAHHINRAGYTQNGQLLGAGIGPGANSDQLNLIFEMKTQSFGALLQRIEHNKDYHVTVIKSNRNHDVEYSEGVFYANDMKNIRLIGEATFSHNMNRYWMEDARNFYLSMAIQVKLNQK